MNILLNFLIDSSIKAKNSEEKKRTLEIKDWCQFLSHRNETFFVTLFRLNLNFHKCDYKKRKLYKS